MKGNTQLHFSLTSTQMVYWHCCLLAASYKVQAFGEEIPNQLHRVSLNC